MKTASYSTKGFVTGSTIFWIVVISQISLMLLVPLLFTGLHPFILTGVLLGFMYFGFMAVTGNVIYTVDAEGLTKQVTPTLFKNLWRKRTFQYYSWDQIKSFREGTELSRAMGEFDFLTIHAGKKVKLEINTKKGDRSSFKEFVEVFRSYVREAGEGTLPDPVRPVSAKMGETVKAAPHAIREKPEFYKTAAAKFLTVFFILVLFGLAALMVAVGGSSTNWFRLAFVMLPGVLYMVWRVFVKKGEAR